MDKSDKQEGFQANDPGDYARFAAKLVPGMIQGAANAPTAIGEAVSGVRTKDDGSKEKLSGAQRTGALADGVISTAGIPFGGSGTLVKGAKAAGKSIFANHASHQATKLAASNALRDLTKDALKEGAEEAIQQFAQDLSDDGKVNTEAKDYGAAFGLGSLGGGMMHGAGRGLRAAGNQIQATRNSKADVASPRLDVEANISPDIPAQQPQTPKEPIVSEPTHPTKPQPVNNAQPEATATSSPKEQPVAQEPPRVTTNTPRNTQEHVAAIQSGTVTPATKHLSVEAKVQTALNSDIASRGQSGFRRMPSMQANSSVDTQAATNQTNEVANNTDTARLAEQASQIANGNHQNMAVPGTAEHAAMRQAYESLGDQPGTFEQYVAQNGTQGAARQIQNGLAEATRYRQAQRAGLGTNTLTEEQARAITAMNKSIFGEDARPIRYSNTLTDTQGNPVLGATTEADGGSQIELNRNQTDASAEATFFHEVVHKALNDFTTTTERSQLLQNYASRNDASPSTTEYQLEEMMADDFIQYVADRRASDAGSKLSWLPQPVRDIFERVFRRIQFTVAKMQHDGTLTNDYIQFYNDLYTGRFADKTKVTPPQRINLVNDGDATVLSAASELQGVKYRIDPETNIVEIDNNILDGVPTHKHASTIREYIKSHLMGKKYDLNHGYDGQAKINARTKKKMSQPDRDLRLRGELIGNAPEILQVSRKISEADDSKNHTFARGGFEYRTATVKVGDKFYDVRINLAKGKDGRVFYTVNGIKENPQSQSVLRGRGGLSNTNIANHPRIVNGKTRYRHPLQDTIDDMQQQKASSDDDFSLRRPKVTDAELKSDILAEYGLKLTKKDINDALDNQIAEYHQDIVEQQMRLAAEREYLENTYDISRMKIRPKDAKTLFGKDYTQFVPKGMLRKDALPIDVMAQEQNIDGIHSDETIVDILNRYMELRQAELGLKQASYLLNNLDVDIIVSVCITQIEAL